MGAVQAPKESLHWKSTLAEKSLAVPGELNLHQWRAGSVLYQLTYIPIPKTGTWFFFFLNLALHSFFFSFSFSFWKCFHGWLTCTLFVPSTVTNGMVYTCDIVLEIHMQGLSEANHYAQTQRGQHDKFCHDHHRLWHKNLNEVISFSLLIQLCNRFSSPAWQGVVT